jgi:carbon storage regulator
MLVLTRKVGAEIFIGDQINIKVIEISGNKVRLGIDAPVSMRIYREEILAKVKNENRYAATWELTDYLRFMDTLPQKNEEQ